MWASCLAASRRRTRSWSRSCEMLEQVCELTAVSLTNGAVFIVKTAVAQAVMQLESDSFLGPVVNPYNRNLTAGGSTGGEGALLGGRGSVIGCVQRVPRASRALTAVSDQTLAVQSACPRR